MFLGRVLEPKHITSVKWIFFALHFFLGVTVMLVARIATDMMEDPCGLFMLPEVMHAAFSLRFRVVAYFLWREDA